jgi:putative ABC transport system permease protein
MHGMLRIALRDLQWRTRRIVIAVGGASLVLALALVMSGLSAGFDNESARTVAVARGTAWIVDAGGTGPFLQPTPLSAATVASIVDQVGPDHAAPFLFGRQSVRRSDGSTFGKHQHVNLVGAPAGRLGSPTTSKGRSVRHDGEVVVDVSLGAKIGQRVTLGTKTYEVVGSVRGARLLAGVPNVYVTLRDAQVLAFGGRDLATAVVVDEAVTAPAGTKALDNREAQIDGLRPVVNAQKTIAMVRSLLWLVAALIVGSVMYLGAIERTKDVAVLKGMGARSIPLAGSLALQAIVLGAAASAVGTLLAVLIAPAFPLASEIPLSAYLLLPVVAMLIGLVSSLAAARRLFSIQPALAFGS